MIYTTNTHREINATDSLREMPLTEEHSEFPEGEMQRRTNWQQLPHILSKPRVLFLEHPGLSASWGAMSITHLPCTAFLELTAAERKQDW
jgi:hypothetical protein